MWKTKRSAMGQGSIAPTCFWMPPAGQEGMESQITCAEQVKGRTNTRREGRRERDVSELKTE